MKDLQDSTRRAAGALAVILCAACGSTVGHDAARESDRGVPAVDAVPPMLERVAPDRPAPRRDREVDALPPLFDEHRAPEVRRDERPPQMRVA